jgi:hypothetical protein
MKMVALLFLFVLSLSFHEGLAQATDSCYDRFTTESAKTLVKKTQESAELHALKREEQRNQLMVLTITVLAGIVGFVFAKDVEHKRSLLWVALFVCVFMHGLDTILLDLSNKQVTYGNRLNCYLLQWDSLDNDGIKLALTKVRDGNEPNDGFQGQCGSERKVKLFFWAGAFLAIWWWGLFFGIVAFIIRFWKDTNSASAAGTPRHDKK